MKLNNNSVNFQSNLNNAFESAKNSQIPGGTYVCSLVSVKLVEKDTWHGFIVNLRIHGGKYENRRIGALLNIQPDVMIGDDGKVIMQDGKAVIAHDEQGNATFNSLIRKLNILVGLTVDKVESNLDDTTEFARVLNMANPEKVFKATIWASPSKTKVDFVYSLKYIKPIMAKDDQQDDNTDMGGHVEMPM